MRDLLQCWTCRRRVQFKPMHVESGPGLLCWRCQGSDNNDMSRRAECWRDRWLDFEEWPE